MFNCIELDNSKIVHELPPFLPVEYYGRTVSINNLRGRIKNEHKEDLLRIDDCEIEELIETLDKMYSPKAGFNMDDPLSFNSAFINLHIPKRIGLFSVLDLMYSDFLIIESLSLVKDSLSIGNLRKELVEVGVPGDEGVVQVIDYSIVNAVFHLMSAVYRVRSCYDKFAVLLGHCLNIGKQVKRSNKYTNKLSKILASDYAAGIVHVEKNKLFNDILYRMKDLSDLKDLRDHEAHVGNIGVKHGFDGIDAKH
jgi:hypothetical protein